MKQKSLCQSDLVEIALRLKDTHDILMQSNLDIGCLKEDHLNEELVRFYAMKGFFDGKIVKFFVDRRKYFRVKEFKNLRKLFGIKRSNTNER